MSGRYMSSAESKEVDAPAVYLSGRFMADFTGASLLGWGLAWFFGAPFAPLIGLLVGCVSASQAQRPRIREALEWEKAVLASARKREAQESHDEVQPAKDDRGLTP
jgi:hypothetical protein